MMQAIRLRRLVHRGTVFASGLVVDAQRTGEDEARRRVLRELIDEAGVVFRFGHLYVVRFRRGSYRRCSEAQGSLLTKRDGLLTAAPLDSDEQRWISEAHGVPRTEHVVVVEGGELAVHVLHGESVVDVARWLDVSSFVRVVDVESLGGEALLPVASSAPPKEDVRSIFGAPPMQDGGTRLLAALTNRAKSDSASLMSLTKPSIAPSSGRGGGTIGAATAFRQLLASFFLALGAFASASGATARPRVSRATPSIFDSISLLVRRVAAHLLVWARLGPLLGRKHAAYMASILDAFDRGDVDEVLRRGLPLGGEAEKALNVSALGGFADRRSFEIRPAATRASSTVLLGGDLFELLRKKYRALISLLQSRGDVDKAAFVLAELLHETEEAVAFLQKHGRFVLAAELAEARGLAPSVAIRSWFLAGDKDRAVSIARRTGAFADAVAHLERSHPKGGRALRLVWADVLARQGSFAAAIDVIWPVEEARALTLAWLEHAIAIGGVTAMRALVKKLVLQPEAFPAVRDLFRERMSNGDISDDGDAGVVAMGEELVIQTPNAATRLLAKLVVRESLHRMPPEKDRDGARLTRRLLDIAGDGLFRADVSKSETLQHLTAKRSGELLVRASNATSTGKVRTTNEDAPFASLLDQSAPWQSSISGRVDLHGVLLAAFDGTGGLEPPNFAAVHLIRHAWLSLREHHRATEVNSESARGLVAACRAANTELLREIALKPSVSGASASGTLATVEGDSLIVAHAGDTRGYVLREGRLSRMTTEHTLAELYRRRGQLPDDAKFAPVPEVIVSCYGTRDEMDLDVLRFELRRGDVVMLCTDGLWRTVRDEQISEALMLPTPERACADLIARADAAGAPDNVAVVVARFEGAGLAPPNGAPVVIEPQTTFDGPGGAVPPLAPFAPSNGIRRSREDVGATPVLDAVELPDGRLLLALGEMGLRLLSRDGRTLTNFKEPAHRLVPSDQGTRVIVASSRGASTQLARLDLTTKRLRPWCDARVDIHARDFDGGIWYAACGDALFAIDALADGWEHLWSVSRMAEGKGRVTSIGRAPASHSRQHGLFHALVAHDHFAPECWTFQSDHQVLRARHPLPLDEVRQQPGGAFQLSSAGGVFLWYRVVDAEGHSNLVGEQWHEGPGWRTFASCGDEQPLTPIGNDTWSIFPTRSSEGVALRVFDVRRRHPDAFVIHLDGSSAESSSRREFARLQGNRLVVFDDHGRVLVIALDTRRVVRDLRII